MKVLLASYYDLSLIIFALWMQNPPASKTVSMNCYLKDCEPIPLSFTQPYAPQEISLVSKPYLLMIKNNRIEEQIER